jgi:uncharacterized protein (TIGR03067 family)
VNSRAGSPNRLAAIAAVLAVLALQPRADAQQPAKAAAALQGTWSITSINGQAAGQGQPELVLVFKGDAYEQSVGGEINERGSVKLDVSKKPMTIDLSIAEGSDAGKTQLGIFEVSGDTLRASFDTPGAGKRPADYEAREGALSIVGTRKKG